MSKLFEASGVKLPQISEEQKPIITQELSSSPETVAGVTNEVTETAISESDAME
jgi:hypothetical protein